MSEDLAAQKCRPCEGGVPKLEAAEIEGRLPLVPGWRLVSGAKLHREFAFRDFAELMGFVNEMATIAETEGHHPDFCVHYSQLAVTIWTHALDGLSHDDFVLAAKIDRLAASQA